MIPARIYRIDRGERVPACRSGCSWGGSLAETPDHEERLLAHERRVAADLAAIEAGHERARQGVREPREPRSRGNHVLILLPRQRRQYLAGLLAAAGGRLNRLELRRQSGLERRALVRAVRSHWFRCWGGAEGSPRGWVELTPEGWAAVASPDTGG